jgi:hypothetical protein
VCELSGFTLYLSTAIRAQRARAEEASVPEQRLSVHVFLSTLSRNFLMKDELAGALSTLGSMQHFTIPGLDTAASLCGLKLRSAFFSNI